MIYKINYKNKTHLAIGSVHFFAQGGLQVVPQNIAKYEPNVAFNNFYVETGSMSYRLAYSIAYAWILARATFSKDSVDVFLKSGIKSMFNNIQDTAKQISEDMIDTSAEMAALVKNAEAKKPLKLKHAESFFEQATISVTVMLLTTGKKILSFFMDTSSWDLQGKRAYDFNRLVSVLLFSLLAYAAFYPILMKGVIPTLVKFIAAYKIFSGILFSYMSSEGFSLVGMMYGKAIGRALRMNPIADKSPSPTWVSYLEQIYNAFLFMEQRNYIQANAIMSETENSIFMYAASHFVAPESKVSVIDVLKQNGAEVQELVHGQWYNI